MVLRSLSVETLEGILLRLDEVEKELCSVRIAEQFGEHYLYSVAEMTQKEYSDYLDSGGAWSYHAVDYYRDIVVDRIRQLKQQQATAKEHGYTI